jgi:hypothetical protein
MSLQLVPWSSSPDRPKNKILRGWLPVGLRAPFARACNREHVMRVTLSRGIRHCSMFPGFPGRAFVNFIDRSSISCRSGNCLGLPGNLVPGPWGSIPGPRRGVRRGVGGPPNLIKIYMLTALRSV